MSHNVDFIKLKKKLEQVSNIREKISVLEQLIQVDPTHPFLAMQKKKFREQLESLRQGNRRKSRSIDQNVYQIKRGKYQACFIGAANSGKSTLLSRLTNATPTISDIPFATYKPEIGNMDHGGVKIQLVEVPAIFEGDSERENNKYSFIKQTDLKIVVTNYSPELDTVLLELWGKEIMLGENNGPKGLVVYREKPLDTKIPQINVQEDVAGAIYKELGISRVYIDNPALEKPISFRNEEINVAKVRELLERKDRKLTTASILEPNKKWRQVGLDYRLNDGDHIKFKL